MARIVPIESTSRLPVYESLTHLAGAVRELKAEAEALAPRLRDRTLWMVNSTATGGGVAEMLPAMVELLRELGVPTEWVVLETTDERFFSLTKQIHNLIHGAGDPTLPPDARELFEQVSRENAADLAARMAPGDTLVVHDPQPMPLARLLREAGWHGSALWRCHIGLDERTPETRAAWEFLAPYADDYQHAAFSAPEYIPEVFATKSTVVYPAVDPMTPKNRDLPVHHLAGVLSNGALAAGLGPVLTPGYPQVAQRLLPSGQWVPANQHGDVGLLTRPIVTQISRWDRLKGWLPLLEAFQTLKAEAQQGRYASDPVQERRIGLCRLVLAGPDPSAVADDPEGRAVLEELSASYAALPAALQEDVAVLALPMQSTRQNALMVNAIQRCSSVVVQNSIREGFGLTVTEAMWKRLPVLSNAQACGPRQQIRDRIDGRLVEDPTDTAELAGAMGEVLSDPMARRRWGASAQRRVHDEFLIFVQIRRWLRLLATYGMHTP